MVFFVDVVLIKIEVISKGFFEIVIENLDNKFVINGFFFGERLKVVFVKGESC